MQRIAPLFWCLTSSVLLWLSFFPFNLGWLGWVALVPLIFVLERYVEETPSPRWWYRPLLSAWLGGLIFCLFAFRWICLASPPMIAVYIILSLVISLQWYFFFQFSKLLNKSLRLPLILSAAISWSALEYIRSQIWIGYAWYYLGHTQHDELYFIQIADHVGVYGLTFIMVMVNVALARMITKPSIQVACYDLVPAVVLVGLASWYGSHVLHQDAQQLDRPQTPRLAILQGNQPQDLRNDPEMWRKIDETYTRLGDTASTLKPELIVTPETCISVTWIRLKGNTVPDWALAKIPRLNLVADRAQSWANFHINRWQTELLFGFNTFDLRENTLRHTNSAILINRQAQEVEFYDKIVCLPFGEYIPCAETLPFMKWLSPYEYEYTIRPGTELKTLPWKNYQLAPLICYEDTVPDLVRQFMLARNPSFFVNISNDGWFKGSEEHEQHLVCARFRCIEHRRSMIRAVNMGVSCIIDAMGRIIALPARLPLAANDPGAIAAVDLNSSAWHDAKNREGILLGSVPLYTLSSVYTQWGDILPWLCWAMMIAAFVVSLVRRTKRLHGSAPASTPHSVRG